MNVDVLLLNQKYDLLCVFNCNNNKTDCNNVFVIEVKLVLLKKLMINTGLRT